MMCLDCQNRRICVHYDNFVKANETFQVTIMGSVDDGAEFSEKLYNLMQKWCSRFIPIKDELTMKKDEMEKLRQQLEEDGYVTAIQQPIHHPHQNQFKIIVTGRKDE